MSDAPELKIFLSSPGDVAEERALAEIVLRRLADEATNIAHLRLVIWEHEPLFAHTGFQEQIPHPSQCDLVVSIIWSRLGTRLPADFAPASGEPPPTGTEFELKDALKSFADIGKPNLLIYRKVPGPRVELGSTGFGERTRQYNLLDDFCRRAFYDTDGAVIVAHHTFTDSHDFERRLSEHVHRWLHRSLRSPFSEAFNPLWKGQSPYRGLQPFEAEHRAIFFGRSEALGDLIRRIREIESTTSSSTGAPARLLLVQGMSGSGKTSLFNAGLLPFLGLRPVEGIAQWTTILVKPSESDPGLRVFGPLGILAARLTERVPAIARLGGPVVKIAELLATKPDEAAARIETCLAAEGEQKGLKPEHVRLLIYFDQLEETFAAPESGVGSEALFGAIVALARSELIWVAATLRSDFSYRLEAFPDLIDCLACRPAYTLMPPRPDELAEMIREPARAAGLLWEQREGVSLDQALLRDATGNPEALPLLEYTLAELYERREGRLLRWSSYGGGLKGALIDAAEEVVEVSEGSVESTFRDVMRELVSVGVDGAATRRYATLARFPDRSPKRALLERLIARRLCVTTDEGRGDGPVASLAHEALILSWPRAQNWLKREDSLLRLRDELARDAAAWEAHGRNDDWLDIAPEKLAAIARVDEAGLLQSGLAIEYARMSRNRALRNAWIRRFAITAIAVLAVVASVAWDTAVRQRNVAENEANIAERTKQFMVSLFGMADPTQNRGKMPSVRELLDKGAADITQSGTRNGLSGEPVIRAELLTAMGQAYTGLGLYEPGRKLLDLAVKDDLAAAVSGESRVRTLVADGMALFMDGKYMDAAKPLGGAVDLARKELNPSNVLRSEALTALADNLVQLGNFAQAIDLCNRALQADRARVPEDVPVLANTLDSLGIAYLSSGDPGSAEAPLREALRLREAAFGQHHARTAQSMNNLASDLYMLGRYSDSLATYKAVLPVYREIFGDEHPEVATLINNIGRSALMAGHVDEAEPWLRQALGMTEKFEGDSHDDLISPLNSLAMIDAYRGQSDMALKEIKRAERLARLPDQGELLDQVLTNEASVEITSGDLTDGAKVLNDAKGQLLMLHPDAKQDAWRYAEWDVVNAQRLAAEGNVSDAEQTVMAATQILKARFGSTGFYVLLAQRQAAKF